MPVPLHPLSGRFPGREGPTSGQSAKLWSSLPGPAGDGRLSLGGVNLRAALSLECTLGRLPGRESASGQAAALPSARAHTHVHTHAHAYTHAHVHTHACTCTHTYTHVHTHAHAHARRLRHSRCCGGDPGSGQLTASALLPAGPVVAGTVTCPVPLQLRCRGQQARKRGEGTPGALGARHLLPGSRGTAGLRPFAGRPLTSVLSVRVSRRSLQSDGLRSGHCRCPPCPRSGRAPAGREMALSSRL